MFSFKRKPKPEEIVKETLKNLKPVGNTCELMSKYFYIRTKAYDAKEDENPDEVLQEI